MILMYGLTVGFVGLTEYVSSVEQGLALAYVYMSRLWPFAFLGAGVWFLIAWGFHQRIIEASVGAKSLSRKESPEIYNLLENLCIARGITMPRLNIIETPRAQCFRQRPQREELQGYGDARSHGDAGKRRTGGGTGSRTYTH